MRGFFGAAAAAILLGGSAASATTYQDPSVNIIVDANNSSTSFNVTDVGPITSIAVTVGYSVCGGAFGAGGTGSCSNSDLTFNSELALWLVSAAGTVVDLVTPGTYFGQFSGPSSAVVVFDDTAASPVGGSTVQSGTFRPVDSLAILLGEEASGMWSLFIGDTASADPKRLDSYNISINTASVVPLPASVPLLLSGLGGLGFLARRKRKKA